jgi:hypothetical protein
MLYHIPDKLLMTPCNAAFRDVIIERCMLAFVARGFTRFRKKSVNFLLHDGFYCWVGLNQGLHSDRLNINPFVGIHVAPIGRLYCGLSEGKNSPKYDRGVATYAVHMGELKEAEDDYAFVFTPEQSEAFIQSEAERLADLYVRVGIPFAQSMASYESLLPLLQERVPNLGGYPQRVASCLYLMGRKAEARAFAESLLGDYPKYREYLEGFVTSFLAMLSAEEQ